jgi:FkbM family methyltransferase
LLDKREFTHVVDAGPAKGMSFVVRLPEDKGIWTGTYEFELATRLAAAVRPGTIGYDIGSWHGFFAGVMAANGAREVHVFEPLPVNADRIRQLIERNPTKVIMLHPVAVGESDIEMDLMIMPETSMAKLEVSGFQPSATPQRKIRVHVRSLDSMLFGGEVPPPSLLKIDVEGAELAVLQGARATLRAHRPEIFAEIHSATLLEQCTLFLTGEGYRTESLNSAVAQSKEIYQIRAFAG